MKAYSQDLRERALQALERGERPSDIARRLEVSRFWIWRVQKRLTDTERRDSLPRGGYRKPRLALWEETLRSWIQEQPDLTLVELRQRLAEQDMIISMGGLWEQLDRWKLTFKKKPCVPANKSGQTYKRRGRNGSRANRPWTLLNWFSWMRPARPPI